jgi:DNA mismatch repair protein MutL
VVNAFEGLVRKEQFPSYWIYLQVDPSRIDINIHPTKTEIKFDDEKSIYAILRSAAKRGIGKYSVSPSLDFDQEMSINIPAPSPSKLVTQPVVQVDESYNPFNKTTPTTSAPSKNFSSSKSDWKSLYEISNQIQNGGQFIEPQADQAILDLPKLDEVDKKPVFQLFGKYLVSTIKSGLVVIDQKRAHERVLYEAYLKSLESSESHIQPSLFPEDIQLSSSDSALLRGMLSELKNIGFDIEPKGADVFVINGVPAELADLDATKTIEQFVEQFKHSSNEKDLGQHERIALSLARSNGIKYGRHLERQEMEELIGKLLTCELPYYTATGKPTLFNLTREDLEQKFNF